MNERMQELLVKAGMQFKLGNIPIHIDSNGTHTFNEFYVYDKFDPEKFAELIIEECSTVIERNLFQGIGWNTSRAVRRHFGIGIEE